MSGVIAYGVYVPRHRLRRGDIAAVLGSGGGRGSRSVAGYDEDTTSIGVEAARKALNHPLAEPPPKRLYFATANPAYMDKTNANVIHAALRLEPTVLSVDVGASVRSGTGALTVASESPIPALVVLSDIRTGLPGGADEREGGDGAAAFLFGEGDGVIAEVLSAAHSTDEFLDRWRLPGAPASRVWEERFGEHVYVPLADAAFAAALKSANLTPGDVDVLVVAGPHARAVRSFAAGAGVAKVADDLGASIGNCGTAHPGIALANALDEAEVGQVIALVVLADGASTFLLRTTEALTAYQAAAASTVRSEIECGRDGMRYADFLTWRGFLTREPPRRPDPVGPAAPPTHRSSDYKFGFVAHRCEECGTVHLPAVRVCVNCKAVDRMADHPMSDQRGTVATYTIDHLAYSPSPPVIAAVVDFDGGGRFSCELTDADPGRVAIGDRVEMTFRKVITAGGVHNYFWKARPIAGEAER